MVKTENAKSLSTAKAVATRRNNKARKKLAVERASLPLFADQLPADSDLPVITPGQVIEERETAREEWSERFAKIQATQERHHVERVARIKSLVSEAEFRAIAASAAACDFGVRVGWEIAELGIKRRAEPLSEASRLILVALCNLPPGLDVTVDEMDGYGWPREVKLKALMDLQDRDYAGGGWLRLCAVTGRDSAPWEATVGGRSLIESQRARPRLYQLRSEPVHS